MEKDNERGEAVKAIRNIADDTSWFRDTPHYWASESFHLAYAVACVEVVSKSSEKARILYNSIIEAWSDAGIKAVSDKITSIIPESEKGKVKNAMLHPEIELLPDPNKADSYLLTTGRTSA